MEVLTLDTELKAKQIKMHTRIGYSDSDVGT
jgi:hypothetical protein